MPNVHTRLELRRRRLEWPNGNVSDYSNIPSANRRNVMGTSAAVVGGVRDTGSGCENRGCCLWRSSNSATSSLKTSREKRFCFFSTIQNLGGPISIVLGWKRRSLEHHSRMLQDSWLISKTPKFQSYELGNSVGVRSSENLLGSSENLLRSSGDSPENLLRSS